MIIFDGKAFAKEKEEKLKQKVSKLKTKPKLVSILVGKNPASLIYTNFEKVVIVGSNGMVGKSIIKELKNLEYNVEGVDIETKNLKEITKTADLLISATGVPNLIKPDMIKSGVAIIDVGSPVGEVDK